MAASRSESLGFRTTIDIPQKGETNMSLVEVDLNPDLTLRIDKRLIIFPNFISPGKIEVRVLAKRLGIRWGNKPFESSRVDHNGISDAPKITLDGTRYIDVGGHYRVDYIGVNGRNAVLQIGSGRRIQFYEEIEKGINPRKLLEISR